MLAVKEQFDLEEHKAYIPEEVQEVLPQWITQQSYGWMKRAQVLAEVKKYSVRADEARKELVDLCTNPQYMKWIGHSVSPEDAARDKLRKFYSSLTVLDLRKMCQKHSVSYDSFMNRNDATGLIEALVDETLTV